MNSSEQQLLTDMKEVFQNFKCTLQDLRNPTEEFVTNFYSYWLQEFEVDINNVTQTQFTQAHAVDMGSYLDAYSGIVPKINLLRCIREFDIVPDFGLLDITSPTPKRTQMILGSFIKFYNWADYNIACIRNKKEELIERRNKLTKMMKEKEDSKENLNNVIKTIAQIHDGKKKLEEQLDFLQQKSSELRLEKEVLKTKTDEIKDKLKATENVLQKISKEDILVAKKIKEFSNLIVDSPSSILCDLENLRVKSEEVKELQNHKRDMVESKMQTHEKLQKALEGHQQRMQKLEELLKLIDQLRELIQIVSTLEKSTSDCQEELKELKSFLNAESNKKQNRHEVLQSLYLRWKTLKPQLVESVEAAIRDLNEIKSEKNKNLDRLKEETSVQEKIDSSLKMIKEYCLKYQNDYKNYKLQQEEFFKSLELYGESVMEMVRKDVEGRYNN